MTKKLLIRCFGSDNYQPLEYAVLSLTDSFLKEAAARQALVTMVAQADPDISALSFTISEAVFMGSLPEQAAADPIQTEVDLSDNGYAFLPDDTDYAGERVEGDYSVYSRDGVSFIARAHHSDITSETVEVPYSFLFDDVQEV